MSLGYSLLMAKRISEADTRLAGVRMGQICVKRSIPVKDVAEYFGVSRMTIYSWFQGHTSVPEKHMEKLEKIVSKLQ